ncbi:MAG: NUDIX hydrolase [Candidatus Altiarchaeota archaeon]
MDDRKPSLMVDGVVVEDDKILLIRRGNQPFKGMWALPGGFVEYGERVEDAVVREVYEETSIKVKVRELLGVYSDPGRDPRGHSVSIVFLCERLSGEPAGGDDAAECRMFDVEKLPELAFDHWKIVSDALSCIFHDR